jgi:hypothetical protein
MTDSVTGRRKGKSFSSETQENNKKDQKNLSLVRIRHRFYGLFSCQKQKVENPRLNYTVLTLNQLRQHFF